MKAAGGMTIEPIAYFHSPFTSKFGIPRQSSIVEEVRGQIVFTPAYADAEAVRGLDGFDYLWLIWGFSANVSARKHFTVRPPRLGGNRHLGVFATRSPFRPNNLGLSSVRLVSIGQTVRNELAITVSGADLMDGTPIYDIKPYVPFVDCHPGVRGGFVDTDEWHTLKVMVPDSLLSLLPQEKWKAIVKTLEQDPRPQYHADPERVYGMPFDGWDVRFRVADGVLTVTDLTELS